MNEVQNAGLWLIVMFIATMSMAAVIIWAATVEAWALLATAIVPIAVLWWAARKML